MINMFSRYNLLRLSLLAVITSSIFLVLTSNTRTTTVHAAEGQAIFSMRPGLSDPSNPLSKLYFIFQAKPGAIAHNFIHVINQGNKTGKVNLYSTDATTANKGGIAYPSYTKLTHAVGSWVVLSKAQATLSPGQSTDIAFTVTVPNNASPGQHVGGISAVEAPHSSSIGNSQVKMNIQNIMILAIQVNVAGSQTEKLDITGVQPGAYQDNQSLFVGLANSGTTMIKAYGTLEIYDVQGHIIQQTSLTVGTILPDDAIRYPTYIQHKALSLGNYWALVALNYGKNHNLSYKTRFSITDKITTHIAGTPLATNKSNLNINWQLIILILVMLIFVAGAFFFGSKIGSRKRAAE